MKTVQKLSLLSAVGGSILIADNVFDLGNNNAYALTQDTDDRLDRKKRAGSLSAILNYLLNEDLLANDDSYLVNENTLLNVPVAQGVLSNDQTNANATASVLDDVRNGALTLQRDGSFSYLPNINFTGTDSFTYQVAASNGTMVQATATIRVNALPQAIDDGFIFDGASPFLENVVTNIIGGSDIIVDGAQVIAVNDELTDLGGRISIQPNGDFEYTPPANLGGQQDSFVYTLQDNDGDTDTATITWQVLPSITGTDTVSVQENSQLQSQFTLFAPGGLEYVEFNGSQFTLTQLNNASVSPLAIPLEARGEFTIIGFNQTTGELDYRYDPTGNSQDHSGAVNDILNEIINIALKDSSQTQTVTGALNINILDTSPVANPDIRSIDEDMSAIAGNTFGTTASAIGDNADIMFDTNPTPVTSANINGSYGSFTISNQGIYTYTLDNTNPSVQGLKSGQSLTDILSYEITDGDNDTDTTTVSITINGIEDALPVITINDDNGVVAGDTSVLENDNSLTVKTISFSATAGLAVSGTALSVTNSSNASTNITLAELSNLNTSPITINSALGQLRLSNYSTVTNTLSYAYNPSGDAQDHSAGDDSVIEPFSFQITDTEGDQSAAQTLEILIADTEPQANADTPSVTENGSALIGNAVFATGAATGDVADTIIDTNANPVTEVNFGSASGIIGNDLNGNYGTLNISSSGVYTYTLDDTNPDVQALKSGNSLTEFFSYSIEDGDGDTSGNSLRVSINGFDDPAPEITIQDTNSTASGQSSVVENQSATAFSNISLSAAAGLAEITALSITNEANATTSLSLFQLNNLVTSNIQITGTDGTLTLTGFDAQNGTLSYSFISDSKAFDHSGGTEFLEEFDFELIDREGDSGTGTLTVLIEDIDPIARNDARRMPEGSSAIAGNAVGNLGAAIGDNADTLTETNLNPVIRVAFGSSVNTVGSILASTYGSFVINSGGVYTYTLDNTNANVQGLKAGETLVETFNYTIEDGDGSTDNADIFITIDGVEDAPPTLSFNTSGNLYQVAEPAAFPNGQLNISAPAGLKATGTALLITPPGGSPIAITLNQLTNSSFTNIDIDGDTGTLSITDYNTITQQVSFIYEITRESGNSTGNYIHNTQDQFIGDSFAFTVIDNEDDSSNQTVEFRLGDTAPTAAQDNASITEDAIPNTVTGDITTNDTTGADTAISVSGINFSGTKTVGTPFASTYGTMDINADGTYTYTLDNGNADVQDIRSGESLVEVFNYTIADTDGDTSSTSLTVTINGVDERPTVIIPNSGTAAAGSDISVLENATTTSTFTLNAESGLNSASALSITDEDNGLLTLSLAQLQNLTTSNQSIVSSDGTLTLTGYSAGASSAQVSYRFDPTGTSRDHSGGDNSIIDTFTIIATDTGNISSAPTDLDIHIADTVPIANDDNRIRDLGAGLFEGQTPIAGNAVGTLSAATGDNQDTLIDPNATPVSDIDFGSTDGTPGSNLASDYGTFNINNAGVYTYTLDNTNPAVQGLKSGEFLREAFVYTITDGDGDTDTATLTVDIDGVEDPAPSAAFNATAVSGGFRYSSAENAGFPAGQLTLTASAGLLSSGTALQITPQGGSAIDLSLSTLLAASPSNTLDIAGSVGTLSINGVSVSDFNTTLSFTFEVAGVPGSFDHSSADPAQDFFALVVTDNEGDTGTTNVEFRLTDTAPTAAPDAVAINEGTVTLTGNVISGGVPSTGLGFNSADTSGADTAISISQIAFMSTPSIVGSPITSTYGTMDINSDGTYTYTLDNGNTIVNDLNNGESLSEVFSYTIVDTDGDTSTTTVTVTINGVTD